MWEVLFFLLCHADQRSAIDERSGVLTYDAWRTEIQSKLRHVPDEQMSGAVLIIDIDRFKQTNDSFGHLAGDQVIRNIAEIVASQVRTGDLVGRFGGDEFVIWLDHTDKPHTISTTAERIRSKVEDLTVTVSTPTGPRNVTGLSVSIGAAPATNATAGHKRDLTALLWTADEAMYRAKHAGGNRVETYQPPDMHRHTGNGAHGHDSRHLTNAVDR